MESLIRQRLEAAIAEKIFPGCVVGVTTKEGKSMIIPVATHADTMYDVASITKSIPANLSLLKLIDEGKLSLDDKLIDFVPEFFTSEDKKLVTIRHILTYTLDLGIPSMSSLKDKTPDEILKTIFEAPLKSLPGSKHLYTNSTAAFIGLIVRKITGMNLDDYADQEFFNPLGMTRTTFHPEKFNKQEIAPTEIDPWRGRVVQGEVHDESTFILQQKYCLGIAGLFSTVPDLLIMQEMLLNHGTYKNKKYFSKEIVEQMYTDQKLYPDFKVSLGWVIDWPEAMGTHASASAFSKSGFTGTFIMTDPMQEKGFVMLSNRTYPHRPSSTEKINEVRRAIADIVFN